MHLLVSRRRRLVFCVLRLLGPRTRQHRAQPLEGSVVSASGGDDRLFDTMMMVRIVDERMMRIQRQGKLGFYMKSLGEEATHLSVFPLRDDDWVFPSYREQGAWFWRGYGIENFLNQLFGNCKDPTKGRQMPVHHSANWLNVVVWVLVLLLMLRPVHWVM